MKDYLTELESTSRDERWKLVRGWMREEPLAFYRALRKYRPVLELPEVTLVARFHDCVDVLRQYEAFGVDLYKPKQGDYWMAQDDTAVHWREKSVMQAILDREETSAIREFVRRTAQDTLEAGGGSIDFVAKLGRAIPIRLVQDWFGFVDSDSDELFEWSYWNQMDAFHNQPFDSIVVEDPEAIVENRERANERMREYLVALIRRRISELEAGSEVPNDPIVRLLKLSLGGAVTLDIPRVVLNVGGLLIGAVETTSHTATNALAVLLERPSVLARACEAAQADDTAAFDGFVFEALRFKPAFPYFFRVCHRPTVMSGGTDYATEIQPSTTVLAVTHSAMHDTAVFHNPNDFEPTRSTENMFHFGQGLHRCLGRSIASAILPEIVRQCLLRPGLAAAGPIDYRGGPVPESFPISWDTD